jgi:hypothetical protein
VQASPINIDLLVQMGEAILNAERGAWLSAGLFFDYLSVFVCARVRECAHTHSARARAHTNAQTHTHTGAAKEKQEKDKKGKDEDEDNK